MNTSGKWNGTITYGHEYGEFAGKIVQFEVEIEQTENSIKGVSIDIDGFGVNPEPAQIQGEIIGNDLKFLKKYRTMHLADSQNTVFKSFKGPKIYFIGNYDDKLNEFIGTWKMHSKKVFFGLIPINKSTSGIWRMKKEI